MKGEFEFPTVTPTYPAPTRAQSLTPSMPQPDWDYHLAFRRQLFTDTPDVDLPKYLLAPEIRQLAALPISEHHRMLMLSLFNTGARINELLDVRVNRVLTQRHEPTGREFSFIKLRTLKQQRRNRSGQGKKEDYRLVRLYDEHFAQDLQRYIVTHCSNKQGYLFTTKDRLKLKQRKTGQLLPPISDQTARNWLAEIEAIGQERGLRLTVPLTPKVLRHSCAIHLVLNGFNQAAIQAHLGHRFKQTTEIYTNLLALDAHNAPNVMF